MRFTCHGQDYVPSVLTGSTTTSTPRPRPTSPASTPSTTTQRRPPPPPVTRPPPPGTPPPPPGTPSPPPVTPPPPPSTTPTPVPTTQTTTVLTTTAPVPPVAVLCGEVNTYVTSSGNTITVVMKSDQNRQFRGFRANYTQRTFYSHDIAVLQSARNEEQQ